MKKIKKPASLAANAVAEHSEIVIAYKGFDQNLKCLGYQFATGETFEHKGKAVPCESGFHACEYPLDVLKYYPPSTSRFAVVEQSGQIARHNEDSKIASTKLRVSAEINLAGLIKAAIEYTTKRCRPIDPNSPAWSTVQSGAATASGYSGAATASGNSGAATASGNSGAATASGYSGAATASGEKSAAMASGRFGRAKGVDGAALFLVFRDENWNIIHARGAVVGKDGIKPATWYSLDATGAFVEVTP